ncbi:MAG: MerR family transcriptional regulator [Nocardioidaceae bacterium]
MPPADEAELTIDELAARVGMTVRNVRAYASRGLIPAPRLAGRTGYYGPVHVKKLQLVRELVDRGYTLAAVEKALTDQPGSAAGHALDLLDVLGSPLAIEEEPEVMTRDALTALAHIDRDDDLVDRLVALGLVEPLDDERLTIVRPSVVRAGTSAIALGLAPETVVELLPTLSEHIGQVAGAFVSRVREQVWQPFVEQGMPEEDWSRVLRVIEALLPVAGQAVLAVFRDELGRAIHDAMGEELAALAGQQP